MQDPFLGVTAWLIGSLLLGQSFAVSKSLPARLLVPLGALYAAHSEAIRAVAFVLALILLGILCILFFRSSRASKSTALLLLALFIAALVTAAAQHLDNLLSLLQRVAQLAATVAGVFLVFIAGPRELARWRRTKYDERSAEAAAAALVATDDFLAAIDTISNPAIQKGDHETNGDEAPSIWARQWFGQRLESLSPQLAAFQKARVNAEIYLSAEQCEALANIASHHAAVVGAWIKWHALVDYPDYGQMASDAFLRLFVELPKERPQLRASARAALNPIARIQMPEARQ